MQGVGYRDWMVGQARAAGLCGWVRNNPDGTVEALVDGPDAMVTAVVQACWTGPGFAAVSGVEVSAAEPGDHAGFHRR